tara:strand:+ start:709 stop:1281 length:573 start_codon:yes stop_codon:yes gene_type:complete
MIYNVFGPSGSGKTTFVKNLLKHKKVPLFFKEFRINKFKYKELNRVSVSLIPLPKFTGNVEELFNIFSIDINILISLENELRELSESIFDKYYGLKNLENIACRNIETFSAGEIRRLFLLKTLLVDSEFYIVDEPFSNSDTKLWNIIYRAINRKNNIIVLSHLSLEKFFNKDENNISLHIDEVNKSFLFD